MDKNQLKHAEQIVKTAKQELVDGLATLEKYGLIKRYKNGAKITPRGEKYIFCSSLLKNNDTN